MTAPWRPPLLSTHASIEIWNALLARCGRPIALPTKGASAVAEFCQSPREEWPNATLDVDGRTIIVAITSFPFSEFFGADLGVEDLGALPDSLRDPLIEGMIATLWSHIPRDRLGGYRIASRGFQPCLNAHGDDFAWFSISLRGLSTQPLSVIVGCRPAEMTDALLDGSFGAAAPLPRLRETLTLDAFFLLGRVKAAVREIKDLRSGAVLVLPHRSSEERLLRVGSIIHRLRVDGERLIYRDQICSAPTRSAPPSRGIDAMPIEAPNTETPEAAPAISQLQLDIDADLGSTRASLAQIEGWRPGSIVELDYPATTDGVEVMLRCSGQALASGDLLVIDDRLAVRITRLLIAT